MTKFTPEDAENAQTLIKLALYEDLRGASDVTSSVTIPEDAMGRVSIVSRESGVAAGLPLIELVAGSVDPNISVQTDVEDGATLKPGTRLAVIDGPVRSLLTAERTILNFLTHLSGIATLTSQFVSRVAGTNAAVLDTRKTLPGWRSLAKYAVRCGGGTNHRMGLYDGCLIKDNHIASWRERHPDGSLADLVADVREQLDGSLPIEIEVDTLTQLRDVLPAAPDIALLDNMRDEQLREAVAIRDELAKSTQLEASGGVNLVTVAGVAETGIDRISVGALTHSAKNFDVGFDWQ